MTTKLKSLIRLGFCKPSSIIRIEAPCSIAAFAAFLRSLPTQVGAPLASNSGSSPTCKYVWFFKSTCRVPFIETPYPLLSMCGVWPRDCKILTMAITVGVLPAPPITKFPTQITGTETFSGVIDFL